MYDVSDTIAAVSSPTSDKRVIIRISGPEAFGTAARIFSPAFASGSTGILWGKAAVDADLEVDADLYLFAAPCSYTAEPLAEIHIDTNQSVTETMLQRFFARGLRPAGPGEFTARAYLNGKIDLAQAEAVNEVVTSSNRFQLEAAERLLGGKLAEDTEVIRCSIMDCLGLLEAGLDFSGEDIELVANRDLIHRLGDIKGRLEELLRDSIYCESVIDLPAVGIAGATNAGKSSLLNKMLGRKRSIVSGHPGTTRDVLTAVHTLANCRCVLFDCAGLIAKPQGILDELAQAAAIEALHNSCLAVFCVDVSKENWDEDISLLELIEPKALLFAATKSDLLPQERLTECLEELKAMFGADFVTTSAKTGAGIERLQELIDTKIVADTASAAEKAPGVALTARHRQAVNEAIDNITESVNELRNDNGEVAAMMLRAAYQAVSGIEQQSIDEQILENIFSRFCIGK
jgi:tRNA modification GTPase